MYKTQRVLEFKKKFEPQPTNLNEDEEEMSNINAAARVIFNNKKSIDYSPEKYPQFQTHNQSEFSPKF